MVKLVNLVKLYLFQAGSVYCASVAGCSPDLLPQGAPGLEDTPPPTKMFNPEQPTSPLLPKNPRLSWRENIGPPESGHDPLPPNEIDSEQVWAESSRSWPRRRRRRPKTKSSAPFTLSPEFVAKYISSPTPSTTLDVSDPWWAYNGHPRKANREPRTKTNSDLWKTPSGPKGHQSDSNQYS